MSRKKTEKTKKSKKHKKYYIEFSMAGLFLWGLAILLILAWIFVLGIFVGRDMLPDSIQPLAVYPEPSPKAERKTTEKPVKSAQDMKGNSKIHLFYHNVLVEKKDAAAKSKTDVTKRKTQQKRVKAVKKAKTSITVNSSSHKPEKAIVAASNGKNIRKTGKKKIRPAEKAKKVVQSGTGSKGRYTIQLTSVLNRLEAIKLTNKLVSKGYPAFYTNAVIRGRTYYRVRCGRFLNRAYAKKFRNNLMKKEGISGFITTVEN